MIEPRVPIAPDVAELLPQLEPARRSSTEPDRQRADYRDYVTMFRQEPGDFTGTVVDEVVPSPEHDVPVRRYTPSDPRHRGHVLVYLHGGGWVLGDLDTHDAFPRLVAERTGLEVVSVGYRLAPEHPYPAPWNDCAAVVSHVGATAEWIALCGDSAGGNLAASIAATTSVDAQVLIYPGLAVPNSDDRSLDGRGLDRDDIDYFWAVYRGDRTPDARLAPLLNPHPLSAPPTLLTTAGHDPLRPDGLEYVRRLAESDVAVTYLPHPNLVHGWLELADGVPSARAARDEVIDAIAELHRRTTAHEVSRR
ncbi:alpha/beta hydrolase [Rhodococcoides corynebacterioides]|uniref:alpha/beta hydrolase n=1 Tax=Rhodococcoides corynebacterioides TaxID=53972 RepID=UPI000A583867|nr:alpha/beta hydrolase [Rhodococcus corynebacterioides]MBY6361630.1 alpha/beta hydrolase [Rhodococcus corynebacterioides]